MINKTSEFHNNKVDLLFFLLSFSSPWNNEHEIRFLGPFPPLLLLEEPCVQILNGNERKKERYMMMTRKRRKRLELYDDADDVSGSKSDACVICRTRCCFRRNKRLKAWGSWWVKDVMTIELHCFVFVLRFYKNHRRCFNWCPFHSMGNQILTVVSYSFCT